MSDYFTRLAQIPSASSLLVINGQDPKKIIKSDAGGYVSSARTDHLAHILIAGGHSRPNQMRLQVFKSHPSVTVTIHQAEGLLHDPASAAVVYGEDALEFLELDKAAAIGVGCGDHASNVIVGSGGKAGKEGAQIIAADSAVTVSVEDV